MKKMVLLLFSIIALSWAALCIPSVFVFGRLKPLRNTEGPGTLPLPLSGMALTGMRVYGTLGCAACHTQQIRQSSFTPADIARHWGSRGSLLRDTLAHPTYFPGSLRIGPDLSNYALRQQDPTAVHRLLYASGGARMMPRYAFLYRIEKIQGAESSQALKLPDRFRLPIGYQVIPTYEAECLVAYLLSLKSKGSNE
ncbi:MAG: cytochrome oxidase [Verrucomicrobia bacterium]|nr:MAG: cytochrome oxidase [Verrucomicrobiota bacterium]